MHSKNTLAAHRALVRRDLAMGQYFRAFDRARAALAVAPDDLHLSLMQATALLRTGAALEARAAVSRFDPLLDALDPEHPADEHAILIDDHDAAEMLARIYRTSWRELGDPFDLQRARDLEVACFNVHHKLVDGAAAAVLCRTLHETAQAARLAEAALTADRGGKGSEDEAFAEHFAAAEAYLLLGRTRRAHAELSAVRATTRSTPERGVDARRQLADLKALGVAVPDALLAEFAPPTVVIFAGAPAYAPTDPAHILHPGCEAALAKELDALLEELDATIGYASLAAGGDILFAEAMLRRGGEVNIVLPFEEADFVARRVAPAGGNWVDRYQTLRSRIADISPVSHDLFLGNDVLVRFANQVIDGRARLRAAALDTAPTLVTAWDYRAAPSPGSPSDFIDHWGDPTRLRIIDMAALSEHPDPVQPPADDDDDTPEEPPFPPADAAQRVLAMMFADVVGYSTIQDQHLPAFWRYLALVRERVAKELKSAVHVASWGDAMFIATARADELTPIAVRINETFETTDARKFGLPVRLRLRTGLHAGTAFLGDHPLSKESVLYGGAVNRAARIEPITVPGRIYASEQFVALLASEHSAAVSEARMTGEPEPAAFVCRYRGELSLAKNYGRQAVYEITPPDRSIQQATAAAREDAPVTANLSLALKNEMAEYSRLGAELSSWADTHGIDPAMVTTFEMAFDEILANIINYAYGDNAEHTISVACMWDGHTLSAEVRDDGRPFDPLAQAAPDVESELDERPIGGLGLFLVREIMDIIAYRREGDENILSFAKHATG